MKATMSGSAIQGKNETLYCLAEQNSSHSFDEYYLYGSKVEISKMGSSSNKNPASLLRN